MPPAPSARLRGKAPGARRRLWRPTRGGRGGGGEAPRAGRREMGPAALEGLRTHHVARAGQARCHGNSSSGHIGPGRRLTSGPGSPGPGPGFRRAGRALRRASESERERERAAGMRGWAAGGLLLLCGVCNTFSLEIKVNPEVRAFVDEQVTLKCSFRSFSPITEKLTVDWTYQPLTGGHTQTIFHFQSVAYPAVAGTFRDRILWVGNIGKGDASIAIQNPTMNDNGTFTCAVKNPPDVHHNIPQTKLTVTHRRFSSQLMSAVLLSVLVFLPSAIVLILLLVRMGRKFGALKHREKSGYKKSSIEVSDDELEHSEPGTCLGKMGTWCLHCVDTDEEEPY